MPPKEATAARRRTFLTNVQKRQLQQFWSEHPDLQLLAVADWVRERFGVSVGRATLYRIYHAPPEAFAGNGHQKKHRRVKFPALERDIVALCEQSRRVNDCDSALSDDALLRAAAELRARHGISEAELKLSNGWLHRFKERHALRAAPQALGGECRAALAAEETGSDVAVIATESRKFTMGRKRKPRAPPRRKKTQSENAVATDRDVDSGDDCNLRRVDEATATSICGTASCANEPLASDASTSSAFEDTADFTSPSAPAAAQPLTYLSASAADSVTAVGFVRWKLKSGMAHAEHFSVDDDGVSILRSAKYQLNVELQHTAPPIGSLPAIFKVWAGVALLGQCEHPIQSQRGRALSVLQLECMLSSQAVIRVEYHAAGVVYKDSRLVLRLLRHSCSCDGDCGSPLPTRLLHDRIDAGNYGPSLVCCFSRGCRHRLIVGVDFELAAANVGVVAVAPVTSAGVGRTDGDSSTASLTRSSCSPPSSIDASPPFPSPTASFPRLFLAYTTAINATTIAAKATAAATITTTISSPWSPKPAASAAANVTVTVFPVAPSFPVCVSLDAVCSTFSVSLEDSLYSVATDVGADVGISVSLLSVAAGVAGGVSISVSSLSVASGVDPGVVSSVSLVSVAAGIDLGVDVGVGVSTSVSSLSVAAGVGIGVDSSVSLVSVAAGVDSGIGVGVAVSVSSLSVAAGVGDGVGASVSSVSVAAGVAAGVTSGVVGAGVGLTPQSKISRTVVVCVNQLSS